VLLEVLGDGVLVSIEGDVADEEGGGRSVGGVTVAGGAVVALVAGSIIGARGAEVEAELTSVKLGAVLGLEGLLCALRVRELDVSETLATAGVAIGDDPHASELTKLLEFAGEPLLIDVPADVANEEVAGGGRLVNGISLALLGGVLWLGLGLALLVLNGLWLLFLITVARVVGIVGVVRVLRLRSAYIVKHT
jgi:hypothetical protein